MAIGRYTFIPRVKNNKLYATTEMAQKIHAACDSLFIPCTVRPLKEGERLDTIAGQVYGSATLWWVIAAASGIGWGLQVPPGTLIRVPTDLSKVLALVR
tara:strand:+ start:4715 stop:5011 length:297 start_codon:yes stop_codon:yes gene_type:complete